MAIHTTINVKVEPQDIERLKRQIDAQVADAKAALAIRHISQAEHNALAALRGAIGELDFSSTEGVIRLHQDHWSALWELLKLLGSPTPTLLRIPANQGKDRNLLYVQRGCQKTWHQASAVTLQLQRRLASPPTPPTGYELAG